MATAGIYHRTTYWHPITHFNEMAELVIKIRNKMSTTQESDDDLKIINLMNIMHMVRL